MIRHIRWPRYELMKYLPLLWSGIWRQPGRTVLVFLQVCVAFALFGVLQGLKTGVDELIKSARADLLLVDGRLSIMDALPVGMLGKIESVPGVRVVVPVELTMGIYQKPNQMVGIVAIPPVKDWVSAFTYHISAPALAAFANNRTAALAREELVRKYGWKIGDRIPLKTTIQQRNGATDWEFQIVGTCTDSDLGSGSDVVLIQYPYFDEARVTGKGKVSHFNVAVADPRQAIMVADEIDRRFANSANETRTDSLRELAQQNMQSIGDLNFLIRSVIAAVLGALLFGTATMMMQS